jgi:hypothetical protein
MHKANVGSDQNHPGPQKSAMPATELGYVTAHGERGAVATEHLISILRLFEAFSVYCFRRGVHYFVDSGTLLGCIRHRSVIPWDNDVDVAMLNAELGPFLESFSSAASGLSLDRHGYNDPDGCVWFKDPDSGDAGLDLSPYEPDGRALMALAVQRQ